MYSVGVNISILFLASGLLSVSGARDKKFKKIKVNFLSFLNELHWIQSVKFCALFWGEVQAEFLEARWDGGMQRVSRVCKMHSFQSCVLATFSFAPLQYFTTERTSLAVGGTQRTQRRLCYHYEFFYTFVIVLQFQGYTERIIYP